ncbi:N-myc-interactor [Centroberyx affinis]|uniref:N-myc-interactor n=1 Tax=Centroberyx affinis TaxID=166261 RepID=UPI003A5C61BD
MADLSNNTLMNGKMDGGFEEDGELAKAKRELETWRAKVEKADDVKGRLLLEKHAEDEAKKNAQKDMTALSKKEEECKREFNETMEGIQVEILQLEKGNQHLMDRLKKYQAELESKRAEATKLKQKFKIYAQILDTKVKFTGREREESEHSGHKIQGVFTISQRPAVLLRGGQALITFEEEKVASQILKMPKCSVSCDKMNLDVKPKMLTLEPSVKFEIHLDVFRKELTFSNAPPAMPEERMRDRLEMSFSRPSRGGGEVERVDYDKNTGTGQITFLHTGVAENLTLRGKYHVDLNNEVTVQVGPVCEYQLRKFQTFCGAPKRTILLDDVDDVGDEEDLQDHLEIHFQKPSNYGGEIESIRYTSAGKRLRAFFCEDTAEMEA